MRTRSTNELRWIVRLRYSEPQGRAGRFPIAYVLACDNAHSVRRDPVRNRGMVRGRTRPTPRRWTLRNHPAYGVWHFESLADARKVAKTSKVIKDKLEKITNIHVEIVELEITPIREKIMGERVVEWIGLDDNPLLVLALAANS